MAFKKTIFSIMITMVFISSGCSENNFSKPNEYGFENMTEINERPVNQHSVEEVETFYREAANISSEKSMKEVIITVNEEEITRGDFESQKKLFDFQYDDFSVKEIVYSLIKPRIINAEAERLNLKPSQERIEQYMEGIHLGLAEEEQEAKKFIFACINGRGITIEDYLKEQEDMAYSIYQREKLYEYIEASAKKEDMNPEELDGEIDAYINNLLKYANIQIYDPEIKKACLAR